MIRGANGLAAARAPLNRLRKKIRRGEKHLPRAG
jgi:hypothetical protein